MFADIRWLVHRLEDSGEEIGSVTNVHIFDPAIFVWDQRIEKSVIELSNEPVLAARRWFGGVRRTGRRPRLSGTMKEDFNEFPRSRRSTLGESGLPTPRPGKAT